MPRAKPQPKPKPYRTGAPHRAFMAVANGFRRLRTWVFRAMLLALGLLVAWVLLYRFVAPPGGLFMWQEYRRLGDISHDWVPLEQIAPVMARSAVAAEDANFCRHWGFDMAAIRQVIEEGETRGASTISQQTVKNVFLWHGRDWTRKALESAITLIVETAWPKSRIIEVYLNIAEFDEGVFGVEAAAQHYFGTSAAGLSDLQAARLAAVLPAPKSRDAARPTEFLTRRSAQIMDGAATIARDGRADCLGG
ncbi:monofunctional biosynthetic peptidoglycan transglycosylase [Roseibaca sp. Y0-43]|uniref:monofunctional biosynthetic peptidoglycan transglycosylase n=1 Tax=Roseibaca sp. Y0-43 TaxID=2816854 RepID=UPI00351D20E5